MDVLFNVLNRLTLKNLFDCLTVIAPIILSTIAVLLTIHYTKRQTQLMLLEKRYESYNLIYLVLGFQSELVKQIKKGIIVPNSISILALLTTELYKHEFNRSIEVDVNIFFLQKEKEINATISTMKGYSYLFKGEVSRKIYDLADALENFVDFLYDKLKLHQINEFELQEPYCEFNRICEELRCSFLKKITKQLSW